MNGQTGKMISEEKKRQKKVEIMEKSFARYCETGLRDTGIKDLAKACGVSRQTINAIEKGDYNPTINLCKEICKVLGKTLDELFWD